MWLDCVMCCYVTYVTMPNMVESAYKTSSHVAFVVVGVGVGGRCDGHFCDIKILY